MHDVETNRTAAEAEIAPTVDDRVLLRAAALGDAEAWDLVVDRHAARIWGLAVYGTSQAEEAVAVCELVWRRLAQALPDLGGEPLATWLDLVTAIESHHTRLRTRTERPHDRRRRPRASGD